MAAIEDRTDVQWLFDRMDEATCMGELQTIIFIIKLEVSDENVYTKNEDTMNKLRHCYKTNEARIARAIP